MKRAGLAFSALLLMVSASATETSAAGLDDPTRPLIQQSAQVQPQTKPALPRLSAVQIDSGGKRAVINGTLMSEGDENNGVKVWKIAEGRAVVSVDGGGPLTIVLSNPPMRKDSG